jgi:hypothetical protein
LVGLFRNHRSDLASVQVGAVGAGRVRLLCGECVRPGPGPANPPAYFDLLDDGDEPGAVGGLSGGEDEGPGATAPVRREVDLAGQAAPRAPQLGGAQPCFATPAQRPALLSQGILLALLPVAYGVALLLSRSPFFRRDGLSQVLQQLWIGRHPGCVMMRARSWSPR